MNIQKIEPTRFQKLRSFMILHNLTWSDLGAVVGLGNEGVHLSCQREKMNVRRFELLVKFGIPADLLPEPKYPKKHEKENEATQKAS